MRHHFKKLTTTSLLSIALSIASMLNASTLSTNFADVYIDNLKIGGSYNLSQVANMPMWVGYRGDKPVDLKIDIVQPTPSELKDGYEQIPDPSWINVSRKTLSLLPDESETVDVTVTIPDDKKYLGKKYQAYVLIASRPPADSKNAVSITLALKGRIRFGIAQAEPSPEEIKEIKKQQLRATQGVMIIPEKFEVEFTSNEKQQKAKREITEYTPLKIINSSFEKVEIFIEPAEPDISGISLPRNYSKGNTDELSFSKKNFTLKPDTVESIRIWLIRNNKTEYKEGEKIFYVLRLRIKSPTIEVTKFVRIYIN